VSSLSGIPEDQSNNKVPAIVDYDGPHNKPYAVFESAVVLIYLAEKSGKFLSQDPENATIR
jgi:GST-like protein